MLTFGCFYSEIGRPSIDPELMIRMLIIIDLSQKREKLRLGSVHLTRKERRFRPEFCECRRKFYA
ncbi:hypothetical protein [Mesorhizobium sp.]|uniref:hypothetical protein n=1 Tax=Mesorhizobium sp. TaxID=1871066 RepID=UPI00345D00CA